MAVCWWGHRTFAIVYSPYLVAPSWSKSYEWLCIDKALLDYHSNSYCLLAGKDTFCHPRISWTTNRPAHLLSSPELHRFILTERIIDVWRDGVLPHAVHPRGKTYTELAQVLLCHCTSNHSSDRLPRG